GVKVVLTRTADTALSLDARAAAASGADLFVSIHANAAASTKAHGIETYYLDVTHDRYAKRLAHRENNGAEMDELEFILADLATKVSARESKALARSVQKRLVRAARRVNSSARDLGVKSAMFHVLLGARCPSILVETAFVSNPREAEMLRRADYQNAIADALADGVMAHLSAPMVAAR
ncbi:MAG: N-acetylmuramoyl-L-alanine amidase, partial [Myxococcota bacterium]